MRRHGVPRPGSYCLTVPTFVPAQANFPSYSLTKTAFGPRKMLIDMSRAEDLRIRNAWVRGSNPLCDSNI
jgi:hypothetical protein